MLMTPDLSAADTRRNTQADLFGHDPDKNYPNFPGAKVGGTSMAAAFKIAAHAKTVRAAVLREYVNAYPRPMTPDQVASLLNESILTVRPRVTELKCDGLLELTPQTLANPTSGHLARALRATAKAREASR
jgi:hypothetical protein